MRREEIAYHESGWVWKNLLAKGLEEDGWQWDWTTLGTLRNPGQRTRARVIAKAQGVWAAEGLARILPAMAEDLMPGAALKIRAVAKMGTKVKPGQLVCEWSGPARVVLALERPFLNLASHVSGIATQTARMTALVRRKGAKHPPRITSTRKTLPGYKDLAVLGVLAGGGHSHRLNLSGGVLIKENHIAAAGNIGKAIEGARAVAPHGMKIEIEVRNLKELDQALAAQADGMLLDNFTPAQVVAAVKRIDAIHAPGGARPFVEVSGGINEATIADYALDGVDMISIGGLTHSVTALDLSLLVDGV